MAISASLLKTAVGQLGDLVTAWQAGLTNVPDDETVVIDVLTDIAAADPALAPVLGLAGALVPVIALAIENNQSAQPGAQLDPSIFGGDKPRGSNPNVGD